tara:strand:+ start:8296 stop:8658 length:363 start_codon:yes stop_codon:yes gene_type:complete
MKEINKEILKEKLKPTKDRDRDYIRFLQQLTDKDLVKNFIAEVKQRNFLRDLYKQNTIEFDDYFKYSGKVEITKEGTYKEYEKWVRKNPMVDKMRDHMSIRWIKHRHKSNQKDKNYGKIK